MGTRLESLNARLELYVSCEASIIGGAQSYAMGSRNLTRANLPEVASMIKYLEKEIAQEESKTSGKGRNKVFRIIPRDF